MHRKTPPWMRPQSADHCGRNGHRKKIAAKFENPEKNKQSIKLNYSNYYLKSHKGVYVTCLFTF
jgi:hypothetical protein